MDYQTGCRVIKKPNEFPSTAVNLDPMTLPKRTNREWKPKEKKKRGRPVVPKKASKRSSKRKHLK